MRSNREPVTIGTWLLFIAIVVFVAANWVGALSGAKGPTNNVGTDVDGSCQICD